jgi:hypothetical protein
MAQATKLEFVPSPYCDCKVCIDHFTRMALRAPVGLKVLEERYIEHLHEIEHEIDDDECEDRFQEAIRRMYSPSLSSALKTRPHSPAL